MESKTIVLKIEGMRDGQPLSPHLLDIDEVVSLLSNARDFLYPDKGADRSRVSVDFEEGSAVLNLYVEPGVGIQAQAILHELNQNHDLSILKSKQVNALNEIQQFISKQRFSLKFGLAEKLVEGLQMDRQTEWKTQEDIWIDEELYLVGEIVDVGGKTNPNVHLDTEEFGTLTISSSKKVLSEDEKNRLYKKQQVRLTIKKNLNTGEYDKKSAILLDFVDAYESENPDEYLDRLIAESAPYWKDVKDPEEWLKNLRGYD